MQNLFVSQKVVKFHSLIFICVHLETRNLGNKKYPIEIGKATNI